MKRSIAPYFLCLLISCITTTLFANTYPVTNTMDAGAGSLRAAIDSANAHPGPDTITFDMSINGDTITLTAAEDIDITDTVYVAGNGIDSTIIDGGGNDRIFEITSGVECKIENLTLRNGYTSNFGGAIYNFGNLSVNNSFITNNNALDNGGGIYNNSNATATFTNSTIAGNTSGDRGGGVFNFNASASFTEVIIKENTCDFDGGGIYNDNNSNATFSNTEISSNMSQSLGGGFFNKSSSTATFTNVTIAGNSAQDNGGGIYNDNNSTATFIHSIIAGNITQASGGGIYNVDATAQVTNTSISGNTSPEGGGGVVNRSGMANFSSVTIAGNNAQILGGGIYSFINSTTTFTNSIIAKNTATDGSDMFTDGTSAVNASHSLIGDDSDSSFPSGNGNIVGTSGSPVDPLFIEDVPTAPSSGGDLRLQSCSPAINAGLNDSLGMNDTLDLFGNPRIAYDTVDMGAFEYPDPAPTDTSFYTDCPCLDTLVIDNATISGLYRAAQVIRVQGNVTLSGPTELWAREVVIDPVFEAPVGIRFETFNTPCGN
jgi:hypothetical protein